MKSPRHHNAAHAHGRNPDYDPRTDLRILGRKVCRTCGVEKDAPRDFMSLRHRGMPLDCLPHCSECARAARRGELKLVRIGRGRRHKAVAPRFWAQVDKSDRCWLWMGLLTRRGYGLISIRSRLVSVHRVAWAMAHGLDVEAGRLPPSHLDIDHLCRNTRCVRAEHLDLVTRAENVRRGLSTKLKEAEVVEIRRARERGERNKDVAARYGVDPTTISCIWVGKTWRSDMAEASP